VHVVLVFGFHDLGTNPNYGLSILSSQHHRVFGLASSRSNIILGEHLSGALIQLLRATYLFKACQQIVRP
jgi:hypothetical protein